MQSRRKFLRSFSTGGVALLADQTAIAEDLPKAEEPFLLSYALRDGWSFCLDTTASDKPPSGDDSRTWKKVQVPHT